MSEALASPPAAPAAPAGATANPAEQLANPATTSDTNADHGDPDSGEAGKPEGEGDKPGGDKPQKTPEQREIERLKRALDRRTARMYSLQAQLEQPGRPGHSGPSRQQPASDTNAPSHEEDAPVSLSRSELQKLITEEAKKLAPSIKQQEAEIEHRQKVVQGLAKEWGQEKFDAYASDLDDAFGGLAIDTGRRDRNGDPILTPKPATDAIFESEMPSALIEYLADPDNAEEAEALGRMGAIQAGRAVAKLEAKLAAKKAAAKPQPDTKAPEPIEAIRAGGTVNSAPDPKNVKAWMKWANEQERRK